VITSGLPGRRCSRPTSTGRSKVEGMLTRYNRKSATKCRVTKHEQLDLCNVQSDAAAAGRLRKCLGISKVEVRRRPTALLGGNDSTTHHKSLFEYLGEAQ
jgi:hypothetical protein